MSNPFGAFTPSTEPVTPEVVDAEYEEVKATPIQATATPTVEATPTPPAVDTDVILEVEAALDNEVYAYRQQLGLISPITLSKILGVHTDTLKGWRSDGRGPNYLKIGKRVWYNYEHVQDWLPTCKVRADHAKQGSEEEVDDNSKEGLQQNERAEGTREPDQSQPAGNTTG